MRVESRFIAMMVIGLIQTAGLAAAAQDPQPGEVVVQDEPMAARGAGIAGGILVGAEIVLLPMAIIERKYDFRHFWPWLVFPAVGASLGGVGGYYLEQASDGGAVALLVTGMVAVIPTLVLVAASRTYSPLGQKGNESNYRDDERGVGSSGKGKSGESETEIEGRPEGIPLSRGRVPVAPSASSVDARRSRAAAGSLLHFDRQGIFGFGVPLLDVRPHRRFDYVTGVPARDGTVFIVSMLRMDLP